MKREQELHKNKEWLYAKKDVHDITIKELCGVTSVAQTTFYAFYKKLDELLQGIEDDLIYHITETTDPFMCQRCETKKDLANHDVDVKPHTITI
jgi:hypothetical protein